MVAWRIRMSKEVYSERSKIGAERQSARLNQVGRINGLGLDLCRSSQLVELAQPLWKRIRQLGRGLAYRPTASLHRRLPSLLWRQSSLGKCGALSGDGETLPVG